MPAVNVTTTAGPAFTVPVGLWGYRVRNNSDTTVYLREGAAVSTSGATMGLPLEAGKEQLVGFAERLGNPLSIQAVHGGSGDKELVYDFLVVQVQAMGASGSGSSGSVAFADITGSATDNTSLTDTFVQKAGDTMTGALNLSANGASGAPSLQLTGSVFTGGSSTTTKPLLLLEPSGTTSNAWNTSGTMLGVNAPSGFGGILLELQVNGNRQAAFDSNGSLLIGATALGNTDFRLGSGAFYWSSSTLLEQNANGNLKLSNSSRTDFGLLQLGGYTSSFPALKRSGTTIQCRLADDSGYAGFNASAYSVAGTAGANFSGAVTSITVVNGIVTAAS